MITAKFDNLEQELLSRIRGAVFKIDIAVSWFTNINLFNALKLSLKNGVRVRLLILNDEINNHKDGLNFQEFLDLKGDLFLCPGPNLMHNKFCIIDDNFLITGSCNWTNNLGLNDENIIETQELNVVSSFRFNFELLLKKYSQVFTYFQSQENRIIDSSFIPIENKATASTFENENLLVVSHIDFEKKYIVLRFLSKPTIPLGRISDGPSNDRTRFVHLEINELESIQIGDFIVFPKEEIVTSSEYIAVDGQSKKVYWLKYPKLNASSFYKRSLL